LLNRHRWQSRYADVRPILNTAAASSTVRKSGSSSNDNPADTDITSTRLAGVGATWTKRSSHPNPGECHFPGMTLPWYRVRAVASPTQAAGIVCS
jgi:hypothetical protein